jgi:serine protease Do
LVRGQFRAGHNGHPAAGPPSYGPMDGRHPGQPGRSNWGGFRGKIHVGYPLSRVLATEAKVSVGNVKRSRRHCRRFSLSADQRAIQPGNSVGPLLDASGHLVGIVTRDSTRYACRSWWGIFRRTYCTQAEVARTFLDSKRIGYQTARSDQQLSSADIGDIARPFTVHIECEQASRRRLAFSLGN